jgi:predicted RNase H-like nuclease (RuvC/YqgF family)
MALEDEKAIWWVVVTGAAGGVGWLLKWFSDKKKQQADTDKTETETKDKKLDYTVKRMQYLEQDNLKLTSEVEQWHDKFKGKINEITEELENTVYDLREKLDISRREIEEKNKEIQHLKSQLTFYRVKFGENIK